MKRLGEVLAERGVPVDPIRAAITEAGSTRVYLAASAFSHRIDLLLPFQPAALVAIAPRIAVPSIPPRAMLLISADGEQLAASMVVMGAVAASDAIADVAPAGGRDAWRAIVDSLIALPGGTLTSRTRSLTDARGTIAIRYLDRDPEADPPLQDGIVDIAAKLGVSETQRALWRKLHAANGVGPAVTIATHCVESGPAPELGFLYRATQWDHAITLANLIASGALARSVAAALGTLAGTLQVDELSAVEVLLGRGEPDVVVWTTLQLDSE